MARSDSSHYSVIQSHLKSDASFKKFRQLVIQARERLHLERDREEVTRLHGSRTTRILYSRRKHTSRKAIIDAVSKDMSVRSRLVEIRTQTSNNLAMLQEAIESARSHIATEYQDDMAGFRNNDQRNDIINRAIRSALSLEADALDLLDVIDVIVKDIDQAGFSIKHMIEILKLMDSSKKVI